MWPRVPRSPPDESHPKLLPAVPSRPLIGEAAVAVIVSVTASVVLVGALLMWVLDHDSYPSYPEAIWFILQTVTTVGYGDTTPTSMIGRTVAAVVMLTGIALITVDDRRESHRRSSRPHASALHSSRPKRPPENQIRSTDWKHPSRRSHDASSASNHNLAPTTTIDRSNERRLRPTSLVEPFRDGRHWCHPQHDRAPMHYERLTAADAVFLRIETPHEPQHVGSLSVIDGAPLRDGDGRVRFDELQEHVERRLHRVPRMRQRVMDVPYNQARPVWIDDDHFDIEHHVRLTALPHPGDDDQLATLMGRLQALPLDRSRPLWEMWFVDGLENGNVGLIIKVHHALGDGMANVDLAMALVDLEADPAPDEPAPAWTPRPAPSPNDLLGEAVREQITRPTRIARTAAATLRDPRPTIEAAVNVGRTVASFLSKPAPAPWNVPVGSHRRWVSASVPLAGVRKVRKQHDATINDVVLAACSGALRTFLLDHGDGDIEHRVIKAMVPVSLRGTDQRGDTLGNLVSLIVVDLPVDEADPVERLHRIHAITGDLKDSSLVDGAHRILEIADAITPVAGPLTRYVSRTIPMNLVITNVPGPPIPLYLRGGRLLRVFPYVEVIDNEGLTIAVVSYDDQLHFGITADRDVMTDLADIAASIEQEFAVLAGQRSAKRRRPQ